MLRVTADTNVIISSLNFSGNPRHVLEMAEDGAIHLAVSDAILDEVERVLRRDKFGWPEVDAIPRLAWSTGPDGSVEFFNLRRTPCW